MQTYQGSTTLNELSIGEKVITSDHRDIALKEILGTDKYRPERKETTRVGKFFTLVAILLPPLGILSAAKLLWDTDLHLIDIYVFAGFYILTGLGITVGYHRLFTHRAFETNILVKLALAILGAMTLQGPLTQWVSDHRMHHLMSDQKGDPHSPVPSGNKLKDHFMGLWHAHVGWMFKTKGLWRNVNYAEDIYSNKVLMAVDRLYLLWVLLSLLLPFGLGYIMTSNIQIGLESLIWGGLIRIFLFQHATFAVNSICHKFGRRQYQTKDNSRNQWLVALLTFGEGWHNNHHAFPRSARHGLGKLQIDVSWLVIKLLKNFKLAKSVYLPKENQIVKLSLRLPK
jgi:stearoyl-CoA desaturase (delta-9 desaturase)